MSQVTIGVIMLFGILLFLIVIRIPIAFALGISSVITAIYLDIPLVNLFMKMVTSMQSFVIIAAPFFVVMAQLMSDGGITKKLMRFCDLIVGRIRGGTAIVNIVVSMLFGGISGSSTADVSSIGSMLIPAMIDEGYDADYSIAVTVTSSLEGIMIPPSQNMLFYAVAAGSGLSISTLLICGYLPGVILTAGLCIPALIIAKQRNYPISTFESKGQKLKIIFEALAGLMAIVIIVVGTTCGICSATESAAVAAVYALLVSALLYRSLTFREFVQSGHVPGNYFLLQRLQLCHELSEGAHHDYQRGAEHFRESECHYRADAGDYDLPGLLYGYGRADLCYNAYSVSACHAHRHQPVSLRGDAGIRVCHRALHAACRHVAVPGVQDRQNPCGRQH